MAPDGKTAQLRQLACAPGVELTVKQLQASAPSEGVRLVIGGPGTGKTTALVAAAVNLMQVGSELASVAILAHTRPQAQQLRRDVIRSSGKGQLRPRATTVHGFAMRLLLDYGIEPLQLLRAPEHQRRIQELLAAQDPQAWPESVRQALATTRFADQLRETLTRARQLGLEADGLIAIAKAAGDPLYEAAGVFLAEYLAIGDLDLKVDYADLLYRARVLLESTEIAEQLRRDFVAVLVDDGQELDASAVALLADLAGLGMPITVFGDPAQRLGDYRGAAGISSSDWPAGLAVETIELNEGFRCGPAVRAALRQVGRSLPAAGWVDLASGPSNPGIVSARVFADEAEELAQVAGELRASLAEGLSPTELGVVVRDSSLRDSCAQELERHGIRVASRIGTKVLGEHDSVRLLLRVLAAVARGEETLVSEASWLLGSPLCPASQVARRSLIRRWLQPDNQAEAVPNLLSVALFAPERLRNCDDPTADQLLRLARLLRQAASLLRQGASVGEALWRIWVGTDWPDRLRRAALAGSRAANESLDGVVELFEQAQRRAELAGVSGAITFVQEIAGLALPADARREGANYATGVSIMTPHQARAYSWRRIWLVGLTEGGWPRWGAVGGLLDPTRLTSHELLPPRPAAAIDMERRLLYASCARASESVAASGCRRRATGEVAPSRFLAQLGVAVEEVANSATTFLAAPELVAELRRSLVDGSPVLRRAAAVRLARLASEVDERGRPVFPAAVPTNWWANRPLSGKPIPAPTQISFSASSLERLLQCPRRWFLQRNTEVESIQSGAARIGVLLHELAASAHTENLAAADLKQRLAQQWDPDWFEAGWRAEHEQAAAEAAIDRLVAWSDASRNQVLGVEIPFAVSVDVAGESVELTGTVDRLELAAEGLRIVDFKSGRSRPTRAEIASSIQLGLYQLAAQQGAFAEISSEPVAGAELVHLRLGEALPKVSAQPPLAKVPTLPGEPLQVGPTWMHDRLAQGRKLLAADDYPATTGPACARCAVAASCPALQSYRVVGQ